MGLNKIFENHFPRYLRIRYRDLNKNEKINENLLYLLKINKLDASKFGHKYIERIKKQAKYIGQ